MEREVVFDYVKDCMNGEPATCMVSCPFQLDIKGFLKKAEKGRFPAAKQELYKTLPFPGVINEICPAPCEKACQRKTVLGEESVSVKLLEKTCLSAKDKKTRKSYQLPPLDTGCAVIGAGPSGLACALYLSRKRYKVTVFEKTDNWGGSLSSHEKFHMFEMEFMKQFEEADVDFRFGEKVNDLSFAAEYDLIFIATGKNGDSFGLLETCDRTLGTTKEEKVFLGGELLGLSMIEGIAHTKLVSKAMESYLQSGNPEYALVGYEKLDCSKNVPHVGVEPTVRVEPSGDVYTEEEAKAEAGRCMQCDCDECIKDCRMLEKFKKKPPRIAIDVAQDGMTRNSVSSACITRQTWSCNQCGHCAEVCPEDVKIGELFELSRADRVSKGLFPPAFHGYWLEEMRQNTEEASLVKGFMDTGTCDCLFFPGCRLGGVNPDYVIRSYEALLKDGKKTGIMLGCCGIPALWAGETDIFERHIRQIRIQWEGLGQPILIYACASCLRTFARFLPEIPVISLYELLPERYRGGCVEEEQMYSVFDPCAAYGRNELKAAVRTLAESEGVKMDDYDSEGRCCGFGGHIQLANPDFYDEIAEIRCQESENPYLVYCVNCKEVFETHGKNTRHILDLYFGLDNTKVNTLEEKRQNNIAVKQILLERYWKESFAPVKETWDELKLEIPAEVQRDMEQNLISEREVKKTIKVNEDEQAGFENELGEVICRMVTSYLTIWVKYRKEADLYVLQEVYCHRMHIREDG